MTAKHPLRGRSQASPLAVSALMIRPWPRGCQVGLGRMRRDPRQIDATGLQVDGQEHVLRLALAPFGVQTSAVRKSIAALGLRGLVEVGCGGLLVHLVGA